MLVNLIFDWINNYLLNKLNDSTIIVLQIILFIINMNDFLMIHLVIVLLLSNFSFTFRFQRN